jgi:hypothetical protein
MPLVGGRENEFCIQFSVLLHTSPRWGEVASQRVRPEVAGPMTGSVSGIGVLVRTRYPLTPTLSPRGEGDVGAP